MSKASVKIKNGSGKHVIYKKHKYECYLCGRKVKVYDGGSKDDAASLDHFVPKSILKSNRLNNLRTCCTKCNNIKCSKLIIAYQVIVSHTTSFHRIHNVVYD